MKKVKKYPVTKDGVKYTVKVREYYDCSWGFTHMCEIKIYNGDSCFPWDEVYEHNFDLEDYTPKKAVEMAFDFYKDKLKEHDKNQSEWQELIDWDGNLDVTN